MEPLIVHRRRVIGPDGTEQVEEVVTCHAERGAVAIERCVRCGYGGSPVFDESVGAVVIDCVRRARPSSISGLSSSSAACAPRTATISRMFTRDVICAEPTTPVAFLADAVREAEVGAFPVVDRARAPIGIVDVRQIIAAPAYARVADVMTARPLRVRDEVSVARAASMMAYNRVHHLVVIGEDGTLLGILSSLDLCRFVAEEAGALVPKTSVTRRPALELEK